MTDFYTLLKQSIVARGIRDPQHRQAVYAQARAALIRQLAAQKLQTSEIAVRVMELDRAMRRLEAELAAEMRGEEAPAHADAAAEAGDEAYAAPPEAEHEASGWDVRDQAVEAEADSAPVEPEAPLHPGRQWDEEAQPTRGAIVRRGYTPPPVPAEDEEELPPPPFHDQWNDEDAALEDRAPVAVGRPRLPPPQRRLGWTLSEKDKVRVLIGAVGALALVLLGLLVYVFLARDSGVTAPINARGEVSDAATAERIASQALDVKQSFVVFDGRDPTVFQATPDNPVHFDSDAQGGFARVGTSTASSGVKVQIGPGLAGRLAGQNIRIVVTARSAVERGALNMRIAYQSGVALSHWQTANLATAYANIGMTWIVPQLRTSPNGSDFLIVEPGIPGDSTAVDIRSIRIDVIGAAPTT